MRLWQGHLYKLPQQWAGWFCPIKVPSLKQDVSQGIIPPVVLPRVWLVPKSLTLDSLLTFSHNWSLKSLLGRCVTLNRNLMKSRKFFNKERRWDCLSSLDTLWCHGMNSSSVVISLVLKFSICHLLAVWLWYITKFLSIHMWENLSGLWLGSAIVYAECLTLCMCQIHYFLGHLASQSESKHAPQNMSMGIFKWDDRHLG